MAKRSRSAPRDADIPSLARGTIAVGDAVADEHFVIFRIADGLFGFRLGAVAEIIRVPGMARMPLVPASLLGLANLRGVVLPVVSLRQLLREPDVPFDDAVRVIVIGGESPVGFLVDRVDQLLVLSADRVESDKAGAGSVDPDLLDGVIKGGEGESTIKILDPQRLLRDRFAMLGESGPRAGPRTSIAAEIPGLSGVEAQEHVALVSFELAEQEYALPLERVREVIPLPDHISEVARSEEAVLGVVTLRERLLPLVSLRALLGLPTDVERERRGKVVVLSMGNGAVGMVTDGTREILRVDPKAIDAAPALLTRGAGDAEITSICRLDHGRRLVALLSPDRLFRSDLVRRVLAEHDNETGDAEIQTETQAMSEQQFVIFRLGEQEFGMPVADVSEIARPPDHVTRLPRAPAFIEGVMNLRGSVVPIVDLRRRFDLMTMEQGGSRRILVLAVAGGKTGFLVDGVSDVMKVPASAICPAPDMSPDQMRMISRVINLEAEGRMIMLVDPAQLLDRVESDVLAKFDRSDLEPASPAS